MLVREGDVVINTLHQRSASFIQTHSLLHVLRSHNTRLCHNHRYLTSLITEIFLTFQHPKVETPGASIIFMTVNYVFGNLLPLTINNF